MITGLFKLIFNLVRLSILVLIFVLIFHTWTIKQAVKLSLSWSLGADVSIATVKMDWKNTGFEIHRLEIGNPYKFSPSGVLAEIPLVIVSVDVPALFQGALHFKAIGLNLRELQIVHSPGQGLNVMELKPLKGEEVRTGQYSPAGAVEKKIKKHMPRVTVDEFILSIGDITFVESLGKMQKQKRIRLGIQGATYYNLNGVEDIAYLIIAPALRKLGFSFVTDHLKRFEADYVKTSSSGGFWDQIKTALTS